MRDVSTPDGRDEPSSNSDPPLSLSTGSFELVATTAVVHVVLSLLPVYLGSTCLPEIALVVALVSSLASALIALGMWVYLAGAILAVTLQFDGATLYVRRFGKLIRTVRREEVEDISVPVNGVRLMLRSGRHLDIACARRALPRVCGLVSNWWTDQRTLPNRSDGESHR